MAKNPILERLEAAQKLDRRRQDQIRNQVGVIDRLMEDGTYDTALQELQDQLLGAQERVRELEERVRELEGSA